MLRRRRFVSHQKQQPNSCFTGDKERFDTHFRIAGQGKKSREKPSRGGRFVGAIVLALATALAGN